MHRIKKTYVRPNGDPRSRTRGALLRLGARIARRSRHNRCRMLSRARLEPDTEAEAAPPTQRTTPLILAQAV